MFDLSRISIVRDYKYWIEALIAALSTATESDLK